MTILTRDEAAESLGQWLAVRRGRIVFGELCPCTLAGLLQFNGIGEQFIVYVDPDINETILQIDSVLDDEDSLMPRLIALAAMEPSPLGVIMFDNANIPDQVLVNTLGSAWKCGETNTMALAGHGNQSGSHDVPIAAPGVFVKALKYADDAYRAEFVTA